MPTIDTREVESFYKSAALGLGALDAKPGQRRRFGGEADARWKGFAGQLTAADRLDLVIRDAAVQHGAGFAPRVIFGLPGLAEDEPFGPGWTGWEVRKSEAVFRQVTDFDTQAALAAAAGAWGLEAQGLEAAVLAGISPASKVVVAGAGAMLALAAHFEGASNLDLADQVLVVAGHPGERQLFGLAVALVGGSRAAQLLSPSDDSKGMASAAEAAGFAQVDLALISADAAPHERAAAEGLAAVLGA